MSAQAPVEDSPAGPAGPPRVLRLLGLVAVCLGVAALAAATFVLSYAGIHAVALQAGIQPRYARGYPLLIDAMLVIVLAAVLALRGAGWPSRTLAWLTLLIVLAAAAGADALHATNRTLPHNTVAVTAAVLPWALVFVAFALLLTMLRHGRMRRLAGEALPRSARDRDQPATRPAPPLPVREPRSPDSAAIVPGLTSQLVSSAAAGAAAGTAVGDVEQPGTDPFAVFTAPGAALAAWPAEETAGQAPGDAVTAVAAPEASTVTHGEPGGTAEASTAEASAPADDATEASAPADDATEASGLADDATGADPSETDEAENDPAAADMPVFHRMWSAPTPPAN